MRRNYKTYLSAAITNLEYAQVKQKLGYDEDARHFLAWAQAYATLAIALRPEPATRQEGGAA